MRKKKSMFGFGLLLLVLVLGVGYAVVTSVGLNINGTAAVKGSDLKVSFNGETEVSSADKVTTNATKGALDATIAVKDLELNESVTATYTIQNEETDVNAKVEEASITNDKENFFEVTTDMTTAKTVNAGGTTTVTVTVKLVKTPVSDADSTANIAVKLTASPVAQ